MAQKPWMELAVPHADIRKGKFDESVFAADLSDVLADRGPLEYRDADTFFAKTYPTTGLVNLLGAILARLSGREGEPVIQLQTPFGGGKTHSLIALYHLFRAPRAAADSALGQEALYRAGVTEVPEARIVTFVGTAADPLKGRTPWGEIAHQLDRYDRVQPHDGGRRAPGKDLLHRVLGDEPILILMDEIAEYTVKARDFEGQVVAFFQELTEAVKVLPRCALVVTLPSSAPYGEEGERVLDYLQRVFGRVEAIYTPVAGEEIYEVLRKRLFESLPDEGEMRRVVEAYWQFYQAQGDDLPREAREPAYREKMLRAYPFHPEVVDILLERWSAYPTFQRTRGVLRLLAEVVSDLYRNPHRAPLIQPSCLNLANPAIRREFLKHIGSEYEGVIASDIADTGAKAQALDRQMGSEYARFRIAQGLATAIFFGSFSAGERQGISTARLRLAVLQPDIPPPLVADALKRLEDSLWYLHIEGGLYAFRSRPNLNRILIEREEMVKEEQVREEVRSRLEGLAGREMEVRLWPAGPADIPDTRTLKLAVLGPEHAVSSRSRPALAGELLAKSGTTFRVYRNTLLVLTLDEGEWSSVKGLVKRYLAWRSIRDDKALMRGLSNENRDDVERKLKDTEESIGHRLLSAYRHLARAADGDVEWLDLGLPTIGARITLAGRVRKHLQDEDRLVERISPEALLAKALAEGEREKPVREIVDAFLRYPHLPIPDSEEVIRQAIREGVRRGVFGLRLDEGRGERTARLYYQQEPPQDIEEAVLVRQEAIPREETAVEPRETPGPAGGAGTPSLAAPYPQIPEAPAAVGKRAFRLRARLPWDKMSDFIRGVVGPLHRDGAELHITVELEANGPITEQTLQINVRETLKQIQAEWEEL